MIRTRFKEARLAGSLPKFALLPPATEFAAGDAARRLPGAALGVSLAGNRPCPEGPGVAFRVEVDERCIKFGSILTWICSRRELRKHASLRQPGCSRPSMEGRMASRGFS